MIQEFGANGAWFKGIGNSSPYGDLSPKGVYRESLQLNCHRQVLDLQQPVFKPAISEHFADRKFPAFVAAGLWTGI